MPLMGISSNSIDAEEIDNAGSYALNPTNLLISICNLNSLETNEDRVNNDGVYIK